MRANDIQPDVAVRHGAYICLRVPAGHQAAMAETDVGALAQRLGLRNEYDSSGGDPPESVAYLRRISAVPGQLADTAVEQADVIVHVAAGAPAPVAEFRAGLSRQLGPAVSTRVLAGELRPPVYTGAAMWNFAYAHRVLQQPAEVMPNVFLVPMSKTADWWRKDWMERHTYFLPRYDDSGAMRSEGHAAAAAPGIARLLRRTYKSATVPAADGDYDFITYFECADADVPLFHSVCAALRDVARNPEWNFVREGPAWHGRRTASWAELFT
jgi:hypothetical protein